MSLNFSFEILSMSSLESMRHVLDLLSDMLQAVNPNDRAVCQTLLLGLPEPSLQLSKMVKCLLCHAL